MAASMVAARDNDVGSGVRPSVWDKDGRQSRRMASVSATRNGKQGQKGEQYMLSLGVRERIYILRTRSIRMRSPLACRWTRTRSTGLEGDVGL